MKGTVAAISTIRNSYGKWLLVTLKLYPDNAQANSVSQSSYCDARRHRNRLLFEHIQENESNAYTKVTDVEKLSETNQFAKDSTGYYINFLVSPEVTLFLLNMEIRPSMHMSVLSENTFNDKTLNSFHINTHSRKNYVWAGLRSDKLFGFP